MCVCECIEIPNDRGRGGNAIVHHTEEGKSDVNCEYAEMTAARLNRSVYSENGVSYNTRARGKTPRYPARYIRRRRASTNGRI